MKNLVVLFGGQSSEHEVSCVSAQTIIKNIDTTEYNLYLIGITKDGRWLLADDLQAVSDGSWEASKKSAVISPDASLHGIIIDSETGSETVYIDCIFPVLHGLYGEDGTVQGLFELANIPYVGCGVLASAVSMDKFYTKIIVDTLGIRQAQYVPVYSEQLADMEGVICRIEKNLDYPVFVKPSNAGSSKGVSKAHDRAELKNALTLASEHDRKILVEETIVGRELECGVLGGIETVPSGVGEVVAADEFYSYDAKYNNEESKTVIGPELPEGKTEEIRSDAAAIFRAVDGFGLARVDFFLEKDTNQVVFNEINTLPGFTAISMYPMLFNAAGIPVKELVAKLIELSYERK
ncbi:MAG: D-alanine--D-alanine ligase family protein [Lachnospiraceae bacterium]